jgi:hypothetical protein
MLTKTCMAVIVFLVCISSAAAEEQLGIAVYPGAKYDPVRTRLLRESLSAQGAAYRTSDDISNVIAFYRKQGLLYLKAGGSAKELARFKKADTGVDVVIQSPWRDARSGAMMTDTLILIIKKVEQESQSDQAI